MPGNWVDRDLPIRLSRRKPFLEFLTDARLLFLLEPPWPGHIVDLIWSGATLWRHSESFLQVCPGPAELRVFVPMK